LSVAPKSSAQPDASSDPSPDQSPADKRRLAAAEQRPDLVIDLRDRAVDRTARATERSKERVVSGRPRDLQPGQTLVHLHEDGRPWDQAERFVYRTYRAAGYCDESPRERVEQLQPWNDRSRFYMVVDGDQVVGTSRIIVAPFRQLPVGLFARTDERDADPIAELSSLAVDPAARGLDVVVHLCRAVFVEAYRSGANALVFVIDDWMVELLVDSYRLPVRPVGVQRRYMGGDVTPTAMTLQGPEFLPTARENPGYWQWMTEGLTPQEVARFNLPIVLTDPEPRAGDSPSVRLPVDDRPST